MSALRDVRKEQGMRQKDLALAAGISPGYLSALEHGLRPPLATNVLEAVAGALGRDVEELFPGG